MLSVIFSQIHKTGRQFAYTVSDIYFQWSKLFSYVFSKKKCSLITKIEVPHYIQFLLGWTTILLSRPWFTNHIGNTRMVSLLETINPREKGSYETLFGVCVHGRKRTTARAPLSDLKRPTRIQNALYLFDASVDKYINVIH